MKTKIITPKISNKKLDSFWYRNKVIGTITSDNLNLIIVTRGSIAVQFKENGKIFKDEFAIKEAKRLNYLDKDLKKLYEFDGWHNNNWFAIAPLNDNDEIENTEKITDNYDDALDIAKNIIKKSYF